MNCSFTECFIKRVDIPLYTLSAIFDLLCFWCIVLYEWKVFRLSQTFEYVIDEQTRVKIFAKACWICMWICREWGLNSGVALIVHILNVKENYCWITWILINNLIFKVLLHRINLYAIRMTRFLCFEMWENLRLKQL